MESKNNQKYTTEIIYSTITIERVLYMIILYAFRFIYCSGIIKPFNSMPD